MQKEIWKDIKGYEGLYQASSFGRVKSLERLAWNGKVWHKLKERILKQNILKGNKYFKIVLCKNGIGKTMKPSVLVAIAFLNHKPCGFNIVVDHKNNDGFDNRLENLQLISNRDNCSKDKKNKTSGFTGVSLAKNTNKWRSFIYFNGKNKCLGTFINEIDAANAYQYALKKLLRE